MKNGFTPGFLAFINFQFTKLFVTSYEKIQYSNIFYHFRTPIAWLLGHMAPFASCQVVTLVVETESFFL